MSFTFTWNNPATISWNVFDDNDQPVLGAVVKATLYGDRSEDRPDLTPGAPVGAMNNLTLAEVGGGLYAVNVLASAIPAPGDYVMVVDATLSAIPIGHWEEPASIVVPSAVRGRLCTLDDVKDWLGIDPTDTSQDSKLSRLITATSADFLNRINRPGFTPNSSYAEMVEVMNWQTESRLEDIFLSNWPITAVSQVTINDIVLAEFDPATPDVLGWVFDETLPAEARQKITLRGLFWPLFETWFTPRRSILRPAPMRVQVTYSGGYDDIPEDVSQAIIEWIGFKKGMAELQGASQTNQSIYLGAYRQDSMVANSSLKASTIDMPSSVAQVIAQYKRPVIG